MVTADPRPPSRLLAWLQLMRLPNVFTAMADVLMGFWFTQPTLSPIGTLCLFLASSACLYTAGMVLNDVYDLEQDRRERPQRPLPSGRISKQNAMLLGMSLLIVGVLLGGRWHIAMMRGDPRSGLVVIYLAILILLYDRVLKRTFAGPLAMGACRTLNVLLGMSVLKEPWSPVHWVIAGAMGLYVTGVTVFARREAVTSRASQLLAALALMFCGMFAMWWYPVLVMNEVVGPIYPSQFLYWVLLWLALFGFVGWRCIRAIMWPEPRMVQTAVKSCILSIIALDALVLLPVRGATAATVVFLLLIPTVLLGRWVYST
jgi:4-hydroxybenzoate polyprenyltransferase